MAAASTRDVTAALLSWSAGDEGALTDLMPLVYEELKKTARAHFATESKTHTLKTTAVVHEVYLKLVDWRKVEWKSRTQFFAFAGKLMRRVLIDYARGKKAEKRGGRAITLSLDDSFDLPARQKLDLRTLLELDRALDALEAIDPRQARVVSLKCFSGLKIDEIALYLAVSPASVKRDWQAAKRWLAREIDEGKSVET